MATLAHDVDDPPPWLVSASASPARATSLAPGSALTSASPVFN